jgi:hypothetical protein
MHSAMMFWGGLILPLLLLLSFTDPAYLASNLDVGRKVLPAATYVLFDILRASPWWLVFTIPMLAAAEWSLCRIRAVAGSRLRAAAHTAAQAGAWTATAAVAALMIGSVLLTYPVLARIDPLNRPAAMEYTYDVLRAALTTFRFARPDYMTSVTFWGGFGWLETIPGNGFVSLLAGGTGLALMGLLIHVARTSDARRAFGLAGALVGFVLSLAAYALSVSQLVPVDLVGRYLFGLYLSMVLICWSGLAWISNGEEDRRLQSIVSLCCVLACTGVHAYCLRLILHRYF